jgi:hypothetical protein
MSKNHLLEQVCKIEKLELELTVFNSKRALSNIDKKLEVKKIGNSNLLLDVNSRGSAYYNRVKWFGSKDLDKLGQILDVYYEQDITPCFDMTPNNINEEVSAALSKNGFVNSEQLVFMQLIPESYVDLKKEIKIVEVTQENAEEFVNIVIRSNGRMDIVENVIERKKQYFYRPNFHNYISYIGNEVAGIGSLFISGKEGYIANDYTFAQFRGNGNQKNLLKYRINKAKELGLEKLYTDVEFGSISHNNMEKIGFKTVFINSFWMKLKSI